MPQTQLQSNSSEDQILEVACEALDKYVPQLTNKDEQTAAIASLAITITLAHVSETLGVSVALELVEAYGLAEKGWDAGEIAAIHNQVKLVLADKNQEISPLHEVAVICCQALVHINPNQVASVDSAVGEDNNSFVIDMTLVDGKKKVFHVSDLEQFDVRVAETAKPILDNNVGYKDQLYLMGVAIESVLEKFYLKGEQLTS